MGDRCSCAGWTGSNLVDCECLCGFRALPKAISGLPSAFDRVSGALLPEPCWLSLRDQSRQAKQIMCSATEDEQPVHLLQSAQFYLSQRAGLLQPSEALFDQPATAQADGIACVSRGAAIQIAASSLFVLCNVRRYIQRARRAHKILRVISLVRAQCDAPRAIFLPLVEHQQRGVALGKSIGGRDHRGGDQSVAILHQRVAQIAQLRLLAIALLIESRVGIGGRFMRLIAALLPAKVRAIAIVRTILSAKALLRSPRLNQRSVHREMFIAHEFSGAKIYFGKELLRHFADRADRGALAEDHAVGINDE